MKVKEDFHKLIEGIEDEALLKAYFDLIERLNRNQTGELWNSLSEKEQTELLISYEESFDAKNLVDHQEVKKQHTKWLRK
ncbi:MAG TPA: hypothetical protein PKC24_04860 [Cyclobacteriaceae bacterium]|nr:hypothetical protein [Cyclobacteriaceae bacterium]